MMPLCSSQPLSDNREDRTAGKLEVSSFENIHSLTQDSKNHSLHSLTVKKSNYLNL